MKNAITLAAIFLLFSTNLSAQNSSASSPHLVFKGVPIDGSLREYTLKMQQSGFTHVVTKDGVAMLKGDFAAYKNCVVGVATLKDKDLVSKITVIFPECETWSTLSSNYYSLKEMLTEKYGEPAESEETFNGYEPDDDMSRIHAVKFDRCKYFVRYRTEKGDIKLSIEHNGVTSCFVQLGYHDKINGGVIKAKAMDDL